MFCPALQSSVIQALYFEGHVISADVMLILHVFHYSLCVSTPSLLDHIQYELISVITRLVSNLVLRLPTLVSVPNFQNYPVIMLLHPNIQLQTHCMTILLLHDTLFFCVSDRIIGAQGGGVQPQKPPKNSFTLNFHFGFGVFWVFFKGFLGFYWTFLRKCVRTE